MNNVTTPFIALISCMLLSQKYDLVDGPFILELDCPLQVTTGVLRSGKGYSARICSSPARKLARIQEGGSFAEEITTEDLVAFIEVCCLRQYFIIIALTFPSERSCGIGL